MPINIVEKLNQIKRIQPELSQVLGRRPTLPEIAQALNLEPNQIREYLTISRQPISLDLRLGDTQDIELINIIPDENHSSDEQINLYFLRQDIKRMLESLTTTQREVLILHFGLENQQPMTLNEIAKRLNVSRERVRQIQQKAIAILRRKQQNQLEDYLVS